MAELATVATYTPTTIEERYALHRAFPLGHHGRQTLLWGPSGLLTVTSGAQEVPSVTVPPLGDEVCIGRVGELVALGSEHGSASLQRAMFDGHQFVPTGRDVRLPWSIDGLDLAVGHDGVAHVWRVDDRLAEGLGRWEPDDGWIEDPGWTVDVSEDERIVLVTDRLVVVEVDAGPAGATKRVVNTATGTTHVFSRATIAVIAHDVVCIAVDADPTVIGSRNRLHLLDGDGECAVDLPGPAASVGGGSDAILVSVFTGGGETLYRVDLGAAGRAEIVQLSAPDGKKVVGANCPLVCVQGYDDVLRVLDGSTSPEREPSPGSSRRDVSRRSVSQPQGTVIHFHGGPESFEVPEPRCFGLPQFCYARGVDWIGLNYPGSKSEDPTWTRRPWLSWRAEITAHLHRAILEARGPIVLVGWSFGAALALACASASPDIRGLILGGTPGPIADHVRRAVSLDPAHEPWFARRFDIHGDDAVFLNGTSGFRPDVPVLELHGADDGHCPLDLADHIADDWAARANPWRRVLLPSRQHYAASLEDAQILSHVMQEFICDVMGV